MQEIRDLFDLSAEIKGVAMVISGLGNQLTDNTDRLTPDAMKEALYGIKIHLDRIAEDLENIERKGGEKMAKKGGTT